MPPLLPLPSGSDAVPAAVDNCSRLRLLTRRFHAPAKSGAGTAHTLEERNPAGAGLCRVGAPRFELGTSSPPDWRANQAAPRPATPTTIPSLLGRPTYPRQTAATGRMRRNLAPCGLTGSYVSVPPCARAYDCAIERPRPAPSLEVVAPRVNRSNRLLTNSSATPLPRSSIVTESAPLVWAAETENGGAPWRTAFASRFERMRSNA